MNKVPNYILAEKDYMSGMKYNDIAEKYGVTINTVKSWKTRYGWNKKSVHTKNEKVCTRNQSKKENIKAAVKEDVEQVVQTPELTDKQRLFCLYYSRCFNATKAYQKAYDVKYETAAAAGPRMLENVRVKNEIQRLKQGSLNRKMLSTEDIFQKYMDIAFSDITDYVEFGQEEVPVMAMYGPVKVKNEATGKKEILTKRINVVRFKESSQVDGTIISEVKQGRDGASIKLLDKQKALQWIAEHMDMATEEQKAKVRLLNAQAEKSELDKTKNNKEVAYNGIPASMIAPVFAPVLFDIQERKHTEYVFPGGRGSTKSSFVSLNIIDLIMNNTDMHAVVMRQVADTMRGSVFQQMLWAIEALGLSDEFHLTVSPLEITRKSTGQKIYFRGADDPGKVKSIKVPFGYIGILWLEELDQFTGPEAVRKIEQSVVRGGDVAYIFKTFNPPKSASNWVNKYIKIPKATRLITWSNYTQVPEGWLGKPFLDEAAFLKEVNPSAYENEYMGVANGTGGMVFDNVTIREITDDEIEQFDRIYNGVDWGWYPDPFHFGRCHYDAARMKLYIFMEYRCNKQSNRQTADKLFEMGITANDLITCDSAENKSVGDYKSYGLFARSAEKGPGSVEYSMKWLQSLVEIVIDNRRCPNTAEEFTEYEYDRDKDGEVISGYPDKKNHAIDCIRYATNPIWKKRGQ